MAGSADLSLQLRKKSLARGYLSAVQIGAPINVARSINPLSKGNIYSGNCVLRYGYTQPLVHPPWERPPFTLRFKTFCTFFLRTTDRCLSIRRNLLSSRISPTFFSFFLSFFFFFYESFASCWRMLLRMWDVLTERLSIRFAAVCGI